MKKCCLKLLLKNNGIKLTNIAKNLGLKKSSISHVLSGRDRSKHVEDEIARLLFKRRDELFPVSND
jgi:transcriptional regulator with XRE-family HTH domain